jgi:hypothetical protein
MQRARLLLPIALLLFAVGALALGAAAHAEAPVIYKWVDENGVAHYTTDRGRIPSAIRDRVIQGGEAARSADWLQRDAGPSAAPPAAAATPPSAAATPAAPLARQAEDVELPEDSDGVHAVEAQPDWSQAPGGEATWAPGDLGEGGAAPSQPAPPVEAAPAERPAATAARAPAPPPPPPPPLEADRAPAAVADEPPVPAPDGNAAEPVAEQAPAPEPSEAEPSAPAAVAAPAPRDLGPDEQAELAELDARIAEVEAKIASDEETLMALISENEATQHDALVDDPKFRDIAQRLPKLQADLERLRERRAQIQPSVPRP